MDELSNLLHQSGKAAVEQLRQLVSAKASATGNLANSIQYEVNNGILQITAPEHLHAVLFGRRPGKAPPRKAIEQWIGHKGIVAEVSRQSLAFLIQRKIAAEGTTGIAPNQNLQGILSPVVIPQATAGIAALVKQNIRRQMRAVFKP